MGTLLSWHSWHSSSIYLKIPYFSHSTRYIVWTPPKAITNPEQLEPKYSPDSALALSNIEEGMGHNAERAQELQEELAQRRASLHQELVEAQALQGKEALLATILEEEMAYQTQVLVLSHLHLLQAEEIKSQSDDIRCLSTLLEKQQAILEKVQKQ